MSKWMMVAAFLCAGLATACGGDDGSGVSGSKSIVMLNDAEVTDLCEFLVDVAPERMVDCGEGLTITVGETLAECTARFKAIKGGAPSCTATVTNAEECAKGSADLSDQQICSLMLPAACQPLFSTACTVDDE